MPFSNFNFILRIRNRVYKVSVQIDPFCTNGSV